MLVLSGRVSILNATLSCDGTIFNFPIALKTECRSAKEMLSGIQMYEINVERVPQTAP